MARSWAILGDLGVKLELMAACGEKDSEEEQDMRTLGEYGWLKAMKYGLPRNGLARVGRCLELEFRDLERS